MNYKTPYGKLYKHKKPKAGYRALAARILGVPIEQIVGEFRIKGEGDKNA